MSTLLIDPPQPVGVGEYSLTALIPSFIHVFQNQMDFQTKTGKPAPAYNPAIPTKGWIDASVSGGTFSMLTYNTAHLDAANQKPVVTQITVPSYLASVLNLPPDSGQVPQSSAGAFLTPIRALLPNEQLLADPFAGVRVINTDIYNPNPPKPVASTGGGFTDADRALLNAIASAVGVAPPPVPAAQ